MMEIFLLLMDVNHVLLPLDECVMGRHQYVLQYVVMVLRLLDLKRVTMEIQIVAMDVVPFVH